MKEIMNITTITSKEIEVLTGKQHGHILRDVDKLNAEYEKLALPKCGEGSYTLKVTKKQQHRMFILTKIQCLDLMTGYSTELRIKVNRRWEELEAKYQNEQNRIASRQIARLENPEMTKALTSVRKDHGKETKAHHYSNENNLIYRIVLGSTAKKYKEVCGLEKNESLRDYLEPLQIDAIQQIQKMNTSLIALDFDYAERKTRLNTYFMKHLNDNCCKELCKTFE